MTPLKLHTYRYGEAAHLPGLSIGVARHAPRGVGREERRARGYFAVWMPMLGPSPALLTAYRKGTLPFKTFASRYRAEMKTSETTQVIRLLATLAQHQRINLGCFCADAATCHRSVLAELIMDAAASSSASGSRAAPRCYASPACSMPEIED